MSDKPYTTNVDGTEYFEGKPVYLPGSTKPSWVRETEAKWTPEQRAKAQARLNVLKENGNA